MLIAQRKRRALRADLSAAEASPMGGETTAGSTRIMLLVTRLVAAGLSSRLVGSYVSVSEAGASSKVSSSIASCGRPLSTATRLASLSVAASAARFIAPPKDLRIFMHRPNRPCFPFSCLLLSTVCARARLCMSKATSPASSLSPPNTSASSSLNSNKISHKQCCNGPMKVERSASITRFSWTSTGATFSQMTFRSMPDNAPRAVSTPGSATAPCVGTSSSPAWLANLLEKHTRISLQASKIKMSLRVWPPCPCRCCGSLTRPRPSTSVKAARKLITICEQTWNF
mmetsp:Transcript_97089/g.278977  ORF Transcript_97089/g.278977 Transcript_97089/m.278977 type:complete len:285 (+) Transcript_97089:96-950(+)